jgi:tRNA 2-thiouridine synthesizing protein A
MIADFTLDCTGLYCPMPIVNTARKVKELAVGQTLEIVADDKGFLEDLPAWSKMTGNELIRMEEVDGEIHGYIRKTAD